MDGTNPPIHASYQQHSPFLSDLDSFEQTSSPYPDFNSPAGQDPSFSSSVPQPPLPLLTLLLTAATTTPRGYLTHPLFPEANLIRGVQIPLPLHLPISFLDSTFLFILRIIHSGTTTIPAITTHQTITPFYLALIL